MICPIDSYLMSQFIFFVKIAIVSMGNAMFKSHKNKQKMSRLMVCPCLMHCCVTRNYPGWRTDSVIDSTVLELQVSPCSFQSQVSPDLLLLYGQLDKSCLPLDYCYYKRVYKKWEGNMVEVVQKYHHCKYLIPDCLPGTCIVWDKWRGLTPIFVFGFGNCYSLTRAFCST